MKKILKRATTITLSVAMLSTAVALTLPWVTASSEPVDPMKWQYAMMQDFNKGDDGKEIDFWQSTGDTHKVQWLYAASKGVDGTQAVFVHPAMGKSDNKTTEVCIPRTPGDCTEMGLNKSVDVTSPAEIWMWVDFTGNSHPERFRITPTFTVENQGDIDCAPIKDAPVYFQTATGWKESKIKEFTGETTYSHLNNTFIDPADLTSFKGYIRIPMSSLNGTVDWKTAHITALKSMGLSSALYFNYNTATNSYVDEGFYLDNWMVVGKSAVKGAEISTLNIPKIELPLEVPATDTWNMFDIENFDSHALGKAYENWGNYCKNVTDTTVAEKGFKGSQAQYVHSTAESTGSGYCQPFYYMGKKMTVKGAEELWVWVDYSSYSGEKNLVIRPRVQVASKGDATIDLKLKSDAPVFYQSDSGLKKASKTLVLKDPGESALVGADLKGFKGFIRMPLSSFTSSDAVDFKTDTITAFAGGYFVFDFSFIKDANEKYVENGYYLDNVLLTGSALTGGTPLADLFKDKAPDAGSWKVSMLDDIEKMKDGAKYQNWGTYCKNVIDSATPGVGFNGSKGLYVHSKAASEDTGYCQPWYYVNKTGDYSGAKEIWIWYDFSKYENVSSMFIRPRITAEGVDGNIELDFIFGAPIYLQTESGVTVTHVLPDDAKINGMINGKDLAGFKGFIRFPLSSFKPSVAVDLKTAKITSFAGMYNVFGFQFKVNQNKEYVETGFVIDNFAFVGPNMNSSLLVKDMLNPPESTTTTTDTTTTTTTTATTTETTTTETTTTTTTGTTTTTNSTTNKTTDSLPSNSTTGTETTNTSTTATVTMTTDATTTTSLNETTAAPEETTTTATTNTGSPKTGDGSPLAVSALIILAAVSGGSLILSKKK